MSPDIHKWLVFCYATLYLDDHIIKVWKGEFLYIYTAALDVMDWYGTQTGSPTVSEDYSVSRLLV